MSHDNSRAFVAVFARSLAISPERISDTLAYNSIAEWDSIAHMVLVAALENHFDIMLETADIIDMSSVASARDILRRHGVRFE